MAESLVIEAFFFIQKKTASRSWHPQRGGHIPSSCEIFGYLNELQMVDKKKHSYPGKNLRMDDV